MEKMAQICALEKVKKVRNSDEYAQMTSLDKNEENGIRRDAGTNLRKLNSKWV